MDFRSLAQMLGYANPAQSDYAKNTTIVPKNEIDRAAIINQIMQGMSRPQRPQGDLPQGQPVMMAAGKKPAPIDPNMRATGGIVPQFIQVPGKPTPDDAVKAALEAMKRLNEKK